MPEPFRSFADLLTAEPQPQMQAQTDVRAEEEVSVVCEHEESAARSLRLFHAQTAEAVRFAASDLLQDIAANVLARELELSPANIEAIIERALRRFAADQPVSARVHPDDASAVTNAPVPLVADPSLRRGDAILQLKYGAIDASLGARFGTVFAECR